MGFGGATVKKKGVGVEKREDEGRREKGEKFVKNFCPNNNIHKSINTYVQV